MTSPSAPPSAVTVPVPVQDWNVLGRFVFAKGLVILEVSKGGIAGIAGIEGMEVGSPTRRRASLVVRFSNIFLLLMYDGVEK